MTCLTKGLAHFSCDQPFSGRGFLCKLCHKICITLEARFGAVFGRRIGIALHPLVDPELLPNPHICRVGTFVHEELCQYTFTARVDRTILTLFCLAQGRRAGRPRRGSTLHRARHRLDTKAVTLSSHLGSLRTKVCDRQGRSKSTLHGISRIGTASAMAQVADTRFPSERLLRP
jgi:hypothetical protein